jgi:hypothetical protein
MGGQALKELACNIFQADKRALRKPNFDLDFFFIYCSHTSLQLPENNLTFLKGTEKEGKGRD